jgi:hypothetical protein
MPGAEISSNNSGPKMGTRTQETVCRSSTIVEGLHARSSTR